MGKREKWEKDFNEKKWQRLKEYFDLYRKIVEAQGERITSLEEKLDQDIDQLVVKERLAVIKIFLLHFDEKLKKAGMVFEKPRICGDKISVAYRNIKGERFWVLL